MTYQVTVVIPNYNGLAFLEVCMASLAAQTYQGVKILVVDNGSTDGSVEWLRAWQEKCQEKEGQSRTLAEVMLLPENTGFSGAVNVGIRASDTPYVILLNNDTRVDPYFVAELVHAIGQSPDIFSVSSKMIQMHQPDLMDDAGDMYSLFGWAYQRGVGQDIRRYQKPRRVFSACAGAAIYRRSVFEEIGYFDERHFAYLEDLDIGYRARIAGYDNVYCPNALVWHVGSGTSGSKYNSFKVKLAARNNIYLNYKNMPAPQLFLNALPILVGTFVKYQFFQKKGFGEDYLAGLKEGLRTAKDCKRVKYRSENFKNYLAIELELLVGALLYVYEFAVRKIRKGSCGS